MLPKPAICLGFILGQVSQGHGCCRALWELPATNVRGWIAPLKVIRHMGRSAGCLPVLECLLSYVT